ncbi:MAG: hypothetical protein H0V44_14720 [Planctomycetes bacterium]|nr:hypothetical protein [Planctomycetota bacterium]
MPTARFASLRSGAIIAAICSAALLQSCGAPAGTPAVASLGPGSNASQESVRRERAPNARTQAMVAKLNAFRLQAFGAPRDVIPSDELYTAAYRHAVYTNTRNSRSYNPNPRPNPVTGLPGSIGSDSQNFVPRTDWKDQVVNAFQIRILPAVVHDEALFADLANGGIYPALRTHTDPMGRLLAVVGGPGIMSASGATESELTEDFVFNGDVWRDDGAVTPYRGYDLRSGNYDETDSIWYSRHGHSFLMRSSLRYIGYGAVLDSPQYNPPWPVLNGQFAGVFLGLSSRPLVNELSSWPKNTANVHRVGTSTDVQGPNQYCGPPIHITLPSSLPFLKDVGVVSFTFDKVGSVPFLGTQNQYRFLQFYSNVNSLVVGMQGGATFTGNEYHGVGGPVAVVSNLQVLDWTAAVNLPGCNIQYNITLDPSTDFTKFNVGDRIVIRYPGQTQFPVSYTITGKASPIIQVIVPCQLDPFAPPTPKPDQTTKFDIFLASSVGVTALFDRNMANAELIAVPIAPLEPNSTYTWSCSVRTADFPVGGIALPMTGTFTTNSN